MTIREWTEKHPKTTKVIKIVVCCAGVACGTACLYHAANQAGIRIEITTREIRELRAADLGYAENLKNGGSRNRS
jgi:hypothetical protein|nr:MAG TPA: iron-sulfur cluster repair protein [Caudoviricetes sp.]